MASRAGRRHRWGQLCGGRLGGNGCRGLGGHRRWWAPARPAAVVAQRHRERLRVPDGPPSRPDDLGDGLVVPLPGHRPDRPFRDAVAQEREVGDGRLVPDDGLLDRPPGALPHGRAPAPAPGEAGEQLDLARRYPARLREPGELLGDHGLLAAALPDHDRHHRGEQRHHHDEVDDQERAAVEERRRAVPHRVQEHRDRVAAEHVERAGGGVAAVGGDARADARHRGEERVRERREHTAQDQREQHAAAHVRLFAERAAEVEDVLGEREARRHDPGVDDAVDDAVELAAAEQQQADEERALQALLDDRGDHRGADHVAAAPAEQHVDGERRAGVDDQRAERGEAGAPEERDEQQARRLGLPAVDPQECGHDRADRAAARTAPRPRSRRGPRSCRPARGRPARRCPARPAR